MFLRVVTIDEGKTQVINTQKIVRFFRRPIGEDTVTIFLMDNGDEIKTIHRMIDITDFLEKRGIFYDISDPHEELLLEGG